MEKKKSDTIVLRILVTIPLFLFLGLVLANAQETSVTKKEQGNQIDLAPPPPPPPPPPPVSEMKVMKGDDGRLYVIDADGNRREVSEKDVPPPPPPPPPVEKRKVIKGDDGRIYIIEADGTKREGSAKDIPPPPPPPGDSKVLKSDASMQSEKALKDQQLKEEQLKKLQVSEQELKDQELKAKQE